MRGLTHIGASAGFAWASLAAVVPRQLSDSTCTTNPATIFVTVVEPSIVPSIIYETILSTVSVAELTVTVTPNGAGQSGGLGSSSCTSSGFPSGSSNAPGLISPVTGSTINTISLVPSGGLGQGSSDSIATVTIFLSEASPAPSSPSSNNGLGPSYGAGPDGGQGDGTYTIVSTAYLTDNPTTTVDLVTVTQPIATVTSSGGSQGSGSSTGNSADTSCTGIVITISSGPGNPLGTPVVVTVFPTSRYSLSTMAPIPVISTTPEPLESTTFCESDESTVPSSPNGVVTATAGTDASGPSTGGPGGLTSGVPPASSACSAVVVTYTLPTQAGETSCITGVATVTPLAPCPSPADTNTATDQWQTPGMTDEPTINTDQSAMLPSQSLTAPNGPGPFGISSSSSPEVVIYTVTPGSDGSPELTGTFTVEPYQSPDVTAASQATDESVTVTVEPIVTVHPTVTETTSSGPGSYGGVSVQPDQGSPFGSVVEVTYTAPAGMNSESSIYTVTYTQEVSPVATVTVPEQTITSQPAGSPASYGTSPFDTDTSSGFIPSDTASAPNVLTLTITPGVGPTSETSSVEGSSATDLIPGYGNSSGPQSPWPTSSPGASSGDGLSPETATVTPLGGGSQIVVTFTPGESVTFVPSTTAPGGQPSDISNVSGAQTSEGQSSSPFITVTATVPGYGSSPGSGSSALPSLVSPLVVTYTVPGSYGQAPTVLTFTTDVPLASPTHTSNSVVTFTLSGPQTVTQSSETTLWPTSDGQSTLTSQQGGSSTCTTSSGNAEQSGDGVSPIVTTIWPPSTLTTSIIPDTTCSDDGAQDTDTAQGGSSPTSSQPNQSGGGLPTSGQPGQSEDGSSTSCSTLQASFKTSTQASSTTSCDSADSADSQDTATDAPTLWPSQTRARLSKTTSYGHTTHRHNSKIDSSTNVASQGTDQSQQTQGSLPTATADPELGMYTFGTDPYGTDASQYGTDLPTKTSDTPNTSTNDPFNQSATGEPTFASSTDTDEPTSTDTDEPTSTDAGEVTSTGADEPTSTTFSLVSSTPFSNATSSAELGSSVTASSVSITSAASSNTTVATESAGTASPTSGNFTDSSTTTPTASVDSSSTPMASSASNSTITSDSATDASASGTLTPSSSANATSETSTDTASATDIASTFGSLPTPSDATVSSSSEAASSTASPAPVLHCGNAADRGDFTLHFDDISRSSGSDVKDTLLIPDPYHRFAFTSGFKADSTAIEQFSPSSGNMMLRYDPSAGQSGQVSVGQSGDPSCFKFDFKGANVGCNSTDLACVFSLTGLDQDGMTQAHKIFETPACSQSSGCALTPLKLDAVEGFANLTALNITATVGGAGQTWWADDMHLAWSDNSCDTSRCRARYPDVMVGETISHLSRMRLQAKRFFRKASGAA